MTDTATIQDLEAKRDTLATEINAIYEQLWDMADRAPERDGLEDRVDDLNSDLAVLNHQIDRAIDEAQANEPWVAKLTPTEFALTQEKVAKVNARATKRGFTGHIELTYDRVTETRRLFSGLVVEEVFYNTSITGVAPCYNGWTFMARVDTIPNTDTFTVAKACGVAEVDRSKIVVGQCDHCNTRRSRKTTYVVQNAETGEQKLVGSTCIKDFLGHDVSFVFMSAEDAGLGEFFNTRGEVTYTVDTVLAVAYLCIKQFGWVPSRDEESVPTKGRVAVVLDELWKKFPSRTARDREEIAAYREISNHVAEALERVPAIKAWAQTLDPQASEFNANMLASIAADEVTRKQIGILAYAPEGFARQTQRDAEKVVQQKLGEHSEFIGNVGDRIVVEGVIKSIRYIDGQFGTTTLYAIATDAGIVKWFASNPTLGDDTEVEVTLKGTVKKHDVYNGVKSTVLTRCAVIGE